MRSRNTPSTLTESSQLTQMREQVGDLVTQTCIEFITEPVNRFILGSEYERLLSLLTHPHPSLPLKLAIFSNAFRAQIPRGIDMVANFDSSLHWQLVDAIGFFNDSIPGRWPYTDESDCMRYLAWSRDYAMALSSTVH